MRHSCYQEYLLFTAGLFIKFLLQKCAACRKSDLGKHRFQKMSLLTSPCLMRKKVEKLLPYLMTFRTCIPASNPESFLYLIHEIERGLSGFMRVCKI